MIASKNILVTGGAGFIGSHLVKHLVAKYPEYTVFNLDALRYSGNLENLKEVKDQKNYRFLHIDITDLDRLKEVFARHSFDFIIHLAAESHVDRSIKEPFIFSHVNILGTQNLLHLAKDQWGTNADKRFYHISTDEVFGSLEETGKFNEKTPYDPRSPYSASKASSDHLVRAYFHTYGLPIVISNCSNNYGPNQFPEKLIPLFINNILNNKPLPVYGTGENIRDWLFVQDHVQAIDCILHQGKIGETYCIGGNNEWTNIALIKELCAQMDKKLQRNNGASEKLIQFVSDRAGHDFRYAIDSSKIQNDLGWTPTHTFEQGLSKTIDWYLANSAWLQNVTTGKYQQYYAEMYNSK